MSYIIPTAAGPAVIMPNPACDVQIGGPQPPRLWSRATGDCVDTGVLVPEVVPSACCDNNVRSWTDRGEPSIWTGVASDSTGIKLVATVENGNVFTSDNCGITWTVTAAGGGSGEVGIACDATGQVLTAINGAGQVRFSNDRGATWSGIADTVEPDQIAVTMNDAGSVIAIASYDTTSSTDMISTSPPRTGVSGTWLNATSGISPPPRWTSISSNSSGSKFVLCSNGATGNIYLGVSNLASTTIRVAISLAGVTPGVKEWSSVASNAVGDVLVAADGAVGGLIYVSTDGGSTWSAGGSPAATTKWSSVASNDAGDVLVAISDGQGIYSSSDFGVTWTLFNPPDPGVVITNSNSQRCIASNSSGKKLVAVFNEPPGTAGDVWTYCDDVVTPAVMGPSQQDLDMRRKAEILQYKKNNSNMSKKQLWARTIKGHGPYGKRTWATQSADGTYTNPNIDNLAAGGAFTLRCPGRPNNCAPTTNSDVPGKQMLLCMRPDIPLTNYIVNRTYLAGGTKWPQTAWKPGDNGFPVGKAGRNLVFR